MFVKKWEIRILLEDLRRDFCGLERKQNNGDQRGCNSQPLSTGNTLLKNHCCQHDRRTGVEGANYCRYIEPTRLTSEDEEGVPSHIKDAIYCYNAPGIAA